MGLFGKPKKKKKVAIGKGTLAERVKAELNMKKRYPQMQSPDWGKPKKVAKKKKADRKTAATKKVQSQLAAAGVTAKDMPSDVDKRKKRKK